MTAPTHNRPPPDKTSKLFRLLPVAIFSVITAAGLIGMGYQEAGAKASKRKSTSKHLVPPPPAYMPSILPELYHRGINQGQEKKTNPYKRYIYTSKGHEEPSHKKANKHVTYWNVK